MIETTISRPDGACIRMRDHGGSTRRSPAPALVLSNSLATDSALWDEVVGRLCADYRVLTYDTRGHGQACRPRHPRGWPIWPTTCSR
jgi:alpha-beta hydrolase superfamily lysophospholipase